MSKRRFHAMDVWMRSVKEWAEGLALADRMRVSSSVMEVIMLTFPVYPEDLR